MQVLLSFAHALADPTRLRILALLREEALCVCELADILSLPQSTLSSHLQVIRAAGLVDQERCDKWMYYRLKTPLRSLFDSLWRVLEGVTSAQAQALAYDRVACWSRLRERAAACCTGPAAGKPRRGVRVQSLPRKLLARARGRSLA